MSAGDYYSLCNRYRGRAVEISTHDGRIHRGIIGDVDYDRVYLQPLSRTRNLGGFSYGWYGYPGFGAGVAFGSIATLVLLPLLFI
ncbi:hypothetical protein [Desulfosporosinus sp.]|uniref:hypothetical protein n=1 Tax=Desulfosporosinus sp. TaxID=157907 RepID=UPI000E88E3E9|nr:hypothetical protein [Desulfosporosinus sp.]MBC2723669.1 hypothetical protein [Desulfosporosinus sp.]MBC2726710.1 hypothetical protein [Desulfosporosinus sp.]HBV88670.1 hypothetical protein [Desulfosporosinus sp.]